MSLRDPEPGLPRGVEGRGRDLRGAAADLLGELVADDDRRRSEAPLDRPLADRVVEREGASGRDECPVERLHAELQVRDPVRGARVVRLVRRHAAVDPHGERRGSRSLRSSASDGEPSDAVRRSRGGAQDRPGRLRHVQLEAVLRRHDLNRVSVDGELGIAGRSTYRVREGAEVRGRRRATDCELRSSAFRQAEKLGEPPPRNAEAATRSSHDHGTRYRQPRTLRRSRQHLRRHGRGRHLDRERQLPRTVGRAVRVCERSCRPRHRGRAGCLAGRARPGCGDRGARASRSAVADPHPPRSCRARTRAQRSTRRAAAAPRLRRRERGAAGSHEPGRIRLRLVRRRRPRRSSPAGPPSWFAANRYELVASHEVDGMRRALLEQRVELRDRLALRQAADVDARDPRARGELALGAGEGEADEDRQERRRRLPRARAP